MRCVLVQRYVSALGWSAIFRSSDVSVTPSGLQASACGVNCNCTHQNTMLTPRTKQIKTNIRFNNEQLIINVIKRMLVCTLL